MADRETARRRLGLPIGGRLVAVSGGGWGVGDLAGAVDAALACDGTEVVVLAGRNEPLRASLETRYSATQRVHVWGFTERMDDLLRAADVAVHSTGGVTSLEALSCGCPLIGYGSSIGHIRVHNRTMAALGLIALADTRAQLEAALRSHLVEAPTRSAPLPAAGADAAVALMGMRSRVRPLPRWRIASGTFATCLAAAAAVLVGLSTDDAYSLASRPLELRPITHVAATQPAVGLVLRAPQPAVARLAHALARRGLHASFAVSTPLAPGVRSTLAALGDDSLPALSPASRVRWLETREQLRGTARFGADRRYLVPPSGLSLGQYLLARSVDASPVAGRMSFAASGSPPTAASAGDIVVVTSDGSSARTVARGRVVARRRAARGRALGAAGLLVDERAHGPRGRQRHRAADDHRQPDDDPGGPERRARPALAHEQWRGEDRDHHLDDEDQRRDLRGRTALQRRHLAQDGEARAQARGHGPHDGEEPLMRAQRIGDELRRQPAPRERCAGREGSGDAAHAIAPAQRVGRQGHGGQTGQGEGQRPAADVMRGRGGRDDRQKGDPGDDRADRDHLAAADVLVQRRAPSDASSSTRPAARQAARA